MTEVNVNGNERLEVVKTLIIPDYDVEMCLVSVNGALFIKSPDFDTCLPYDGAGDLDEGILAMIMADAYEKILGIVEAEFQSLVFSMVGRCAKNIAAEMSGDRESLSSHDMLTAEAATATKH
ncbi:TPA: hypothetical protein I8525_004587 [Aeromonas hydrophila]|nr:hypothetical protein [Aeromonas hydrophila]